MKRLLAIAMGVSMIGASGCMNFGTPNLSIPQPSAEYQQKRAQRFDPYPENETGPEVDGGRPRDYDRALPETTRARWAHW